MNKHFKRYHARKNNLYISLAEFTCGLAWIFIKIGVIITKNGPFPKYTFMLGIEKFYLQILRGTLSTDRDRWRMACCSAAGSLSREHGHSSFHSSRNMLSATQQDPGWQKQWSLLLHPESLLEFNTQNKPGTGSNSCTAFYSVLQLLLLIFSLVPRVALLHDCAKL